MRRLGVVALLLLALGCAGPLPASTVRPVPSDRSQAPSTAATLSSSSVLGGLAIGDMAVVVAGELRQVADPNRPAEHAFESPLHPGERPLRVLGESAHVMVVGGPTKPNTDVYWQVADDAFPGCCAPFGWVRGQSSNADPAIKSFTPACPDTTAPISGNQLIALGLMEAATCFGEEDFQVSGEVRCDRPAVESFLSITGPDWVNDQTLCNLDSAVALYGAVTDLYRTGPSAQTFDGDVEMTAHFNDPSSSNCRWAPGNYMPIPIDNAPTNTAQFACRMSVYVTSVAPTP